MNLRDIYIHLSGYVNIEIEGFFVERFINICFAKGIFLWNLEREKSTYLKARISSRDFKKIRKIARSTKCRVKINSKRGLPILIHRYKKRKTFAFFFVAIFIAIFVLTRFIWNIEILGNKEIPREEIVDLLEKNNVKVGSLKSKIDKESLINKIRLERNDIAWIGIDIKGTNLKVSISESDIAPEVDDPNEICNIVADKEGEIAKIIVQSGTARVSVGDFVKKGDLLVEGVMEGKYTGIRNVPAKAEIYVKSYYEKAEKTSLLQEIETKTGNVEKKIEIKFNKFKINLHKGVSKFQKYDTIVEKKKIRFLKDYYLPFEIIKIENFETSVSTVRYSQNEIVQIIKKKLEDDLNQELNLENNNDVIQELEVENIGEEITVRLKYILLEKIGTKEHIK